MVISEETDVKRFSSIETGNFWVLTDFGKEKYNLQVKKYEYKPQLSSGSSSGMLRVVGTGGQTLGYTTAPSKTECCGLCLGYLIVLVIFIVLAVS